MKTVKITFSKYNSEFEVSTNIRPKSNESVEQQMIRAMRKIGHVFCGWTARGTVISNNGSTFWPYLNGQQIG